MYKRLKNLPKRKVTIIFVSFFILSALFFSYSVYLSGKSLILDELYSIAMTEYSFSEIYAITAGDVHPPLSYWLLKIISSPFNIAVDSVYIYRYFTCFIYLTSLLVCFFPIRRVFGNTVAFITALIIILLPVSYFTYAYVRMYSLVVPLLLAMFVYIYDTYKNNTPWSWIKLFLFTLASMYSHYYALLGAFWMMVIYLIILLTTSSSNIHFKSQIKRYLLAGAALVVCYIPWLLELYKQLTTVNEGYWITKPTFLQLIFSFQYYFSPKHFEEKYTTYFSSSWVLVITTVCFVSLVLIVISGLLAKRDRKEKMMGLWASLTIWVAVIFVLVYSYFFTPVFYVRYTSCYVGLFAISSAIFITMLLNEKSKAWQKSFVAIFFAGLFSLAGICFYMNNVRKINRDLRNEGKGDFKVQLDNFMKGTNGIIYTEEVLCPNLGSLSMYYPQYKYRVIDDGILPEGMKGRDYRHPYAFAPFKRIEAVSAIEFDDVGVYLTTHPHTINEVLGGEYEIIDHLDRSLIYKIRRKPALAGDSIPIQN